MKKFILTLCIAMSSVGAFDQKAAIAVGANLSYGTELSSFGFGVKGQYGFTDEIRFEASFDHFTEHNNLKMWDLNLNAHYLFPVEEKIKVYPLAGITYTNWIVSTTVPTASIDPNTGALIEGYEPTENSDTKLGVNLGAGVQYELTKQLNLTFEAKYQLVSDVNQTVFSAGITYTL